MGSAVEFDVLFQKNYNKGSINYFKLTENPHSVSLSEEEIVTGKSIKIENGEDISLVTTGAQLENCIKASKILRKQGYKPEILYYHTLKPFDGNSFIESVSKTRCWLSVEELSGHDGLFNLCLRSINNKFDGEIKCDQLAIQDFIHGYGTYHELCDKIGLTPDNIVNKSMALID